jgi:hypothetical protein
MPPTMTVARVMAARMKVASAVGSTSSVNSTPKSIVASS